MKLFKILICLFLLSVCVPSLYATPVKSTTTTISTPKKKSKKKSTKKKSSSKKKKTSNLRCECGGDCNDCIYPGKKRRVEGGYYIKCDKCYGGCRCDCSDCVAERAYY